MYTGSCLCGAIAWELAGVPERMQTCHCSRCRRARSAAHATSKASWFEITDGLPQWGAYPARA
jgi:hypothetical protein